MRKWIESVTPPSVSALASLSRESELKIAALGLSDMCLFVLPVRKSGLICFATSRTCGSNGLPVRSELIRGGAVAFG